MLFWDTDILCIVAALDGLEAVAAGLGHGVAQCHRLAAVPQQLQRGRRLKRQFAAPEQIAARVAPINQIPMAEDEWVHRLVEVDGIDIGEAQLFAAALSTHDILVATGDLRALCALRAAALNDPQIEAVYDAFAGRVVGLAWCLAHLASQWGLPELQTRYRASGNTNTTARTLLGYAWDATVQSFEAGLASEARHLEQILPGLMIPPPSAQGETCSQ